MEKTNFSIVFMGTPDFAVESLKAILQAGICVKAVVTSPDKPSGRGLQLSESPVKKYAVRYSLPVLQPVNLKAKDFLDSLKKINADLFVAVAFRMLPEAVWGLPEKGTINLHASLLPEYRGAAPINRAIMNGEKMTGVSTFFIQQKIDTGNIIYQETVKITDDMNAGELHDLLMIKGGVLLTKTIKAISENTDQATPQKELIIDSAKLKSAPKIFREDCRIDWNKDVNIVHNHIRGLSPFPGAYTEIKDSKNKIQTFKIYSGDVIDGRHDSDTGKFITDHKSYLYVTCDGGLYNIKELQPEGKKRMTVEEFLRGYKVSDLTIC